jgi:predicted anti-sigma-YlaC factor YlaD
VDHLDDIALESARTGEAAPEELQHLESCPACRERLAAIEDLVDNLVPDRPPLDVPEEVDRRILWDARRAARRSKRRRTVRIAAWAATVAATVLLGLWIAPYFHLLEEAAPPVVQSRYDLNRDGGVDILDAFWLARTLESESVRRPEWDLNGDGEVDAADTDHLAAAAVSLGRPVR